MIFFTTAVASIGLFLILKLLIVEFDDTKDTLKLISKSDTRTIRKINIGGTVYKLPKPIEIDLNKVILAGKRGKIDTLQLKSFLEASCEKEV